MNQVFLEERSKEKINNFLDEGVKSQEYYRNRASKPNPFRHLGRSFAAILGAISHHPLPEKKRPLGSHQRS